MSFRKPLTLIATAAAVAIAASLAVIPAATAETGAPPITEANGPATVEGGTLIWGISDKWRGYITGNIAKGQVIAESPATLNDDHTVTWVEGSGEVDLAAGTGSITYRGGMTSQGHHGLGAGGGYALDQTLRDARIDLTSTTTARLSAEVDQAGEHGFPEYRGERVELAALIFDEGDLQDGQVIASAVFTEAGADVYARTNEDFQPGAAVDGVVFGIGVEATDPEPQAPASVSLSVSSATICTGAAVTFQAKTSPSLAGVITLWNGETRIGEAVATEDGTATVRTTRLSVGEHPITARFAPTDSGYTNAMSARTTVSVVDCGSGGTKGEGSLRWGVKESFRTYVVGSIANGEIATSKGAKQARGNGVFTFPQAATGSGWNGTTGTVQYAGQVTFTGHDGAMDVTLANPRIQVTSASSAQLRIPFDGTLIPLAEIDLSSGITQQLGEESARFRGARTTLTSAGAAFFSYQGSSFYEAGEELDPITFTIGDASDVETADPPKPGSTGAGSTPAGATPATAAPTADSAAAGSLTWGVSSAFAAYTTCEGKEQFGYSHCAKGTVSTNGVGSGYLFPQAAGGDWDAESQTGTVRYSGIVSFQGYGMTMFSIANPSITVDGPSSATLHTGNTSGFGSVSYRLDLSSASKSEGEGGEVTWVGVRVDGSLTGGPGGGEGGDANSIGFDDLSFTVGTAGTSSFGDTETREADAVAETETLERETSAAAAGTAVTAAGTAQTSAVEPSALPATGGTAPWEWWVVAVSLMAIAGCTSVLAARQRRTLA